MPRRDAWHVVHAINFLNAPAGHQAVFHHRLAARAAFFCGLEDHDSRAVKIACRSEMFCRTEQHGCMPIVPAGVHLAGRLRAVGEVGFFLDWERIHIGAQADDLATRPVSAVNNADNAGLANAFDHLIAAKLTQFLGDNARRAVNLVQKFGIFMKIPSPARDFILESENGRIDGHENPMKV